MKTANSDLDFGIYVERWYSAYYEAGQPGGSGMKNEYEKNDMHNKRIEKIKRQEALLNKGTELIVRLETLLREWKEYQPEFRELMDYYQSPQWREDSRDSDEGRFEDFPCGVLSQDAVYNLYSEQRNLNFEMMHVGLSYLED